LAVGLSSAVMGMTKTVHPPAGATALLAVTSDEVQDLGWFLVGLIVLGTTMMILVACILNNIMRRYPIYWWAPAHTGQIYHRGKVEDAPKDVEKAEEVGDDDVDDEGRIERSERELISIDANKIVVPGWMTLGVEEKGVLEVLRNRLEQELTATHSRGSETTFTSERDAPRDLH